MSKLPAETAVGLEHRLAAAIARRISEARFNLWFRDHTRFVRLGDAVVVGVPNLYFHDWLQRTFGADVRAAAAEVGGKPTPSASPSTPNFFQAHGRRSPRRTARKAGKSPPTGAGPRSPPATPQPKRPKQPHGQHGGGGTWRTSSSAQCNRVAHASAHERGRGAGGRGQPARPLRADGTGKTHLLEGIYGGLAEAAPGPRG